jgi:hypothetical protein
MKNIFGIIVVVLLSIAGLYAYFILGNQLRSSRGEVMGGKYIAKMYADYSVLGKNCQGEDTDSNGYITCNARIKQDGTGVEKTVTLQCPTLIKSYLATSCKEQGIVISQ